MEASKLELSESFGDFFQPGGQFLRLSFQILGVSWSEWSLRFNWMFDPQLKAIDT